MAVILEYINLCTKTDDELFYLILKLLVNLSRDLFSLPVLGNFPTPFTSHLFLLFRTVLFYLFLAALLFKCKELTPNR